MSDGKGDEICKGATAAGRARGQSVSGECWKSRAEKKMASSEYSLRQKKPAKQNI